MVVTRSQARKMENTQNMQSDSASGIPTDADPGLETLFRENVEENSNLEESTPASPISQNSETDPFSRIMLMLQQQQNQLNARLDSIDLKLESQKTELQTSFDLKLENQQKNFQNSLDLKLEHQQKTLQSSLDVINKQQAELKDSLARQEKTLNDKLAQFQAQQNSFQKQLNEKEKLWEDRTGQLQSQFHTVQNTVEQIQVSYSQFPQALNTLETNVQKLQTAHSSLESDISKISTQLQSINIDRDNAIQEKFSAHEKIVVNTFNSWIKEKDTLIKQQLEQELPKAIHNVTQQLVNNKNILDQELKSEIDTLKHELAANKTQEANTDSVAHHQANTVHFPENIKRRHTDDDEVSQSSDSSSSESDNQFTGSRVSHVTTERLVKNKPFQIFSPDKKHPHPVVFIKSIKNSLPSTWSEYDKIVFTSAYMHGESAIWSADAPSKFRTFKQFEKAFLEKYWSEGTQERIRDEINNPKPFSFKKGTLRKYFETYLDKTRYFDDPMPTKEVLRLIKSKLPSNLKRELLYAPVKDIDAFMQAVDNIDLLHEEDMRNGNQQSGSQFQGQRNNNNNSQSSNPNSNDNQYQNNSYNNNNNQVNFSNGNQSPSYNRNGNGNHRRFKKGQNRFNPGYQNGNRNNNSNYQGNNNYYQQNRHFNQNNPNPNFVQQPNGSFGGMPMNSNQNAPNFQPTNNTQPIRTMQIQGQPSINVPSQDNPIPTQYVWQTPPANQNIRLVEVVSSTPVTNESTN